MACGRHIERGVPEVQHRLLGIIRLTLVVFLYRRELKPTYSFILSPWLGPNGDRLVDGEALTSPQMRSSDLIGRTLMADRVPAEPRDGGLLLFLSFLGVLTVHGPTWAETMLLSGLLPRTSSLT